MTRNRFPSKIFCKQIYLRRHCGELSLESDDLQSRARIDNAATNDLNWLMLNVSQNNCYNRQHKSNETFHHRIRKRRVKHRKAAQKMDHCGKWRISKSACLVLSLGLGLVNAKKFRTQASRKRKRENHFSTTHIYCSGKKGRSFSTRVGVFRPVVRF